MEIESEDKERQHYYQNEFFIEKVNYSLNVIFKVINNKMLLRKLSAFLTIKRLSDEKHYKLFTAEVYFIKLSLMIKCIMRLYRRNRKKIIYTYFSKWKINLCYHRKIAEMKQKIEASLEKQNMDEINKLNQKIIDIEKESNDLSKNLSNLQSFEKELKKNIKKFEEKVKKSFGIDSPKIEECLTKRMGKKGYEEYKKLYKESLADYALWAKEIDNQDKVTAKVKYFEDGRYQTFINGRPKENSNLSEDMVKEALMCLRSIFIHDKMPKDLR